MNELTTQNLQQIIYSSMKMVKMDVDIRQDCSGVNMSYNFIGHYISFDEKRLIEAKEEILFPISLETYINILTIHELGHAMDRDNLMATIDRTIEIFEMKNSHSPKELYTNPELLAILLEEHDMNLVFEETAWNNAEKLNKQYEIVDEMTFQAVKLHSLSTYIKSYQTDLVLFQKLREDQSMQIA